MQKKENSNLHTKLPVLPLRGAVLLPGTVLHFDVSRPKSLAALEEAVKVDEKIFITAQIDPLTEDPKKEDLQKVGTIAVIKQVLNLPGDEVRVSAEGVERGLLSDFIKNNPFILGKIRYSHASEVRGIKHDELPTLGAVAKNVFDAYCTASQKISTETHDSIMAAEDYSALPDRIASIVFNRVEDRQYILDSVNLKTRYASLCSLLKRDTELALTEKKIAEQVKEQLDKNQREFIIREHIHALQEELGETDEDEIEKYRKKLAETPVNDEARQKVEKELERLSRMAPGMPENAISTTYVDWILDMPWGKETVDNLNLKQARAVLDEDHYGLNKVKDRIIEYLAVLSIKKDMKGPILCFVGPPGVGKTSIARSIARAMGRKFTQMSLGGVRDEAEIRGHRRTYIGAIPGRVISGMKQVGTMNPVFLFDEIDKMSSDFKGDPASAMLEVLDGEHNNAFRDHYMDIPFDLSRVMFITTANSEDNIPPALLDRMEIIEVSSYTEQEKLQIAQQHLLPKQIEAHGLSKNSVKINDAVMKTIIEDYTREAGVRTLERTIASVIRKVAVEMLDNNIFGTVYVTLNKLHKYLGGATYLREDSEKKNLVGVVNGLAYTAVGGELLKVECTVMEGTGVLQLTGKLGDVMQESAKAALSWIRANSQLWEIPYTFFKENDIHIHVPEGAVPKDGPSAGVTLCTAMISAITATPVNCKVAMTGETTLRGRVLPIGGLKEKLMAAYRANIQTVLIPKENQKDLEDIAPEVLNELQILPIVSLMDALDVALVSKAVYTPIEKKSDPLLLPEPALPKSAGLPANCRGI